MGQTGADGYGGINAALQGGFGGLDNLAASIGSQGQSTFGGLDSLRDSMVNSSVLNSLNQNYGTGLASTYFYVRAVSV